MKPENEMKSKKKYWLDLQDLAEDGEFKKSLGREFLTPPLSPAKLSTPDSSSSSESSPGRREFLQLMGAGLALTAEGCFRRPTEKIVPYINRPEDILPGEANFYASSFYDGGEGFSILVKTREGRPIKIEGNGEADLLNGGGLSPRAQAHVLSLYDPQRLNRPQKNLFNDKKTNRETVNTTFEKADQAVLKELKKGRTALLTPRIPSPSFKALLRDFKKHFSVRHFIYDPLSLEEAAGGQRASYGGGDIPGYNFSRAKFIFSLNCDFLGTYLSPAEFQGRFAESRRPHKNGMSRLVVLESLMSLTGAGGDERHRIRPSEGLPALMALVNALGEKGLPLPARLSAVSKSYKPAWEALAVPPEKWAEWAGELMKRRGQSLILFGGVRGETKDSKTAHIVVNFLNSALGNDGKTVNHRQSFPGPFGSASNMERLVSGLEKGAIKRVIIHKVNPLYVFPEPQRLKSALRKADLVVYTGDRVDETGLFADYILPDSHDLEKWGDWEFKKGVFSVQQPVIRPLYNTRAFEDSLLTWIRLSGAPVAENFYHYVKNRWTSRRGGGFWNEFLTKGVTGSLAVALTPSRVFQSSALQRLKAFKPSGKQTHLKNGQGKGLPETSGGGNGNSGIFSAGAENREPGNFQQNRKSQENPPPSQAVYELALYETSGLKHGDMSNVPWLMEFPDPVTKICWDNYLCLSPAEAERRSLKEGDVVALFPALPVEGRTSGAFAKQPAEKKRESLESEKPESPDSPQQNSFSMKAEAARQNAGNREAPPDSLKVPVHIQPGQSEGVLGLALGFGRTGAGAIGNNVGVNGWPFLRESHSRVSFTKTGKNIPLANVQGHHAMEGRDIVLETVLTDFLKDPSSGLPKHHKVKSLWPAHKYKGHKWGMVIDLNSCTGCGTCIVACQSENNIPTVGKKNVLEGREMHWIRVDRYYEGGSENPRTVHQPVVCMHCDNAPCETVCPVLATVHGSEGTNDMVYNRCVGTRYCSNNCPYKVRRFNWFNYAKKIETPLDMALNPDVTVRSRGVMEKCSFCIQRIHQAKGEAKREKRPMKDGDLQTACQQSCPARAITFGDLNDPQSRVHREFQAENSYALLDDHLNTKPSVRYKTKIRNVTAPLSPSKEKGGH